MQRLSGMLPSSAYSATHNAHRAALDSAAQDYIAEHYKEGVASVFVPSTGKLVIQLVANRYNPGNFWSGRWRSKYEIDLESKSVAGTIIATVHYYEQGNVSRFSHHFNPAHSLSLGTTNDRLRAFVIAPTHGTVYPGGEAAVTTNCGAGRRISNGLE